MNIGNFSKLKRISTIPSTIHLQTHAQFLFLKENILISIELFKVNIYLKVYPTKTMEIIYFI